jgi:CheY-like chemotaxis protein
VIEELATLRELIVLSPRLAGEHVEAVGSTAEALARLERAEPDVVIADLASSTTTGVAELPQAVRRRWPRLGLILLTSAAGRPAAAAVTPAGADAVLSKPFRIAELRALVGRVAARRGT